ncbi:MAG: M15 family metallopeptidase [Alphaproteobacteria bacterium]|nr:M15 family metallopeptidase [Alphaproteobacteria bacterium]
MLISRLNARRYPWANPATRLSIPDSTGRNLDPVFAGRLAALAASKGKVLTCTGAGARRETETQMRLYNTLPKGQAARPGTSFHEYGLAWDTADPWLRSLCATLATANQAELLKFGLFKPMTKGNRSSVLEPWHIQPIETRGITVVKRPQFAPLEYDMELRTFQKLVNIAADNINGPTSMSKAQEFFFGAAIIL